MTFPRHYPLLSPRDNHPIRKLPEKEKELKIELITIIKIEDDSQLVVATVCAQQLLVKGHFCSPRSLKHRGMLNPAASHPTPELPSSILTPLCGRKLVLGVKLIALTKSSSMHTLEEGNKPIFFCTSNPIC